MSRLDVELVSRKLVKSRNVAQQIIKEGIVFINGKASGKASAEVSEIDIIELKGDLPRYVGRGGLKLDKAISEFGIDLKEKVCIDIGASTGGFTDCMLQNGANLVYAVDVGRDQLDAALKNDSRVISLEQTDIREAKGKIPQKADFISIDVSFISLRTVLPFALDLLKPTGSIAALIKPQFEVGKSGLGKNGIVKDPKLREKAVIEIKECASFLGLKIAGTVQSPIAGGDGNIEYLIYLLR
ncbi:MAG: TlyA family RNA methyltransferase [Ruminococcaceae bacterium]|nr:TlyA family RNA methyltransferase [Oscillospiraceae bacterium]